MFDKSITIGLNWETNYWTGLKQRIVKSSVLNRVWNICSGHKKSRKNHRVW